MKIQKIISRLILVLLLGFLCTCNSNTQQSNRAAYSFVGIGDDPDRYDGEEVYVCTGGSSKKYHSSADCKGLRSCGGNIEKVYLEFAEEKGRTPCKMCYK